MYFLKMAKFHYLAVSVKITLALCSALALITHGERKSLVFMLQRWEFYAAWLLNTIMFYLVIGLVVWCNRILDHYYPWQRSPKKRWTRQVGFAFFMPLLISFALASLYFGLYGRNIFYTAYFRRYFLLEALMVFALNMLLYFLYHQKFRDRPISTASLMEQALPLPHQQIAYVQLRNKVSELVSLTGELNYVALPISQIALLLPETDFFQINRWAIVSRHAIVAVRPKKRCLLITLALPQQLELTVSARETPGFKRWWKAEALE